MKLTKNQLKRIIIQEMRQINESNRRVLNEDIEDDIKDVLEWYGKNAVKYSGWGVAKASLKAPGDTLFKKYMRDGNIEKAAKRFHHLMGS